MGTNLFQNHLFEQLLAQPEKRARFLATTGGIPQLLPDIWHKIIPISTMTVMRNVSRELRDVVDAMDMALRRPIEIVKSVIRGRDVRRMIREATYKWKLVNYTTYVAPGINFLIGIDHQRRFHDMAQTYLTTEYLQADYRVDDPALQPQRLYRGLQDGAWMSLYDPRLSVRQFLNQFYDGNHRRRRLP